MFYLIAGGSQTLVTTAAMYARQVLALSTPSPLSLQTARVDRQHHDGMTWRARARQLFCLRAVGDRGGTPMRRSGVTSDGLPREKAMAYDVAAGLR